MHHYFVMHPAMECIAFLAGASFRMGAESKEEFDEKICSIEGIVENYLVTACYFYSRGYQAGR